VSGRLAPQPMLSIAADELMPPFDIHRDIAAQHLRYERLVHSVMDYAIYMLDLDGNVMTWNPGAQRIKGYTEQEVVGQHFSLFFSVDDVQSGRPQTMLDTALERGHCEDEGWRLRRGGVRFWAKVVIDLIRDEDGLPQGFAKVTRDITEQHEAERQLNEVRAELFQAQKLEALGQLTSGLAHDFNNLLAIILGSAKLARASQDPHRVATLLGHIVDAGERGSQLTQQLLTFARHKEAGLSRLEIPPLLESTRTLLSQALPKGIALSISTDPAVAAVDADPSQLEMVVLNLILNARDAISGEGNIHLGAGNCVLAEDEPGLSGRFVCISVCDNGQGIDEKTRLRIFEPFFTTKGVGQGTGLGLSQAYGLARQLGGDLRVESTPGHGTTMRLYLPAALDA
jgi:PAS domain S-box-containing protein